MNSIFRADEFSLQVISSGSFLDNDPGFRGKVYLVETATIRLNHIAMNEWADAQIYNCRDCYENDQDYQDYLARKEAIKKAFDDKIISALGFGRAAGSICITQAVSEVFTVVHIHQAK